MAPTKSFDYLVIGGGSGGLASARKASAAYGAKVAVIEGSGRLGGTCVNVGCVPKKIMWNTSDTMERVRMAPDYGFDVSGKPEFNWNMLKHKRDAYIHRLNGIYERNLKNDKVEYIAGFASFLSPNEVSVKMYDGSGTHVFSAKNILVAVGGHPTYPKTIPGNEHGIDSDGFFELEHQPKRVAIVGAGYIAVEFAGIFNSLGSQTDLFIRHETFLRSFDPVISETLTDLYEQSSNMTLHKQSKDFSKVVKLPSGELEIHYESSLGKGSKVIDCLVWAIGRSPEVEDLGLDKVGVKQGPGGHIVVDDYQNTNVPSVYAIGDVCGKAELTPVAIASGRRLADRLFGGDKDAHLEYENIPSVVFAHPEAGTIGLTEPEAKKKYGEENLKIYTTKFTDMFYAMVEHKSIKLRARLR